MKDHEKHQILSEVKKILESKYFKHSGVLSRFLQFIIDRTLEGKSNEIKEYTIGVEVLGRPASFKPQQDGSVRIHAVRLRKMLDAYYRTEGQSAPFRIFVPRGAYMPKLIDAKDLPEPEATQTDQSGLDIKMDIKVKDSICVLPFEFNVEDETLNDSSLRDGFCAQLSESLSMFEDISVISWFATTQYLHDHGDIRKIGELFKVNLLLSGRMDMTSNEIRIAVYLSEPSDPMPLWSNVFSRDITGNDYPEIIRKISEKIISMLVDYNGYIHVHRYGSRDFKSLPSNTTSLAIFWFYHFVTRNTRDIYFEALKHLLEATKKEPDVAFAWAVLGHLQCNGFIYGYQNGPEQLTLARQSVERALELNPNLQHGLIALGLIKVILQETEEANELFDRCITINPNSGYFQAAISLGYSMVGQYEKAIALVKKAYRSNPVPIWWLPLPEFMVALHHGNYAKAWSAAPKYSAAAGILENIFELIALFYMKDIAAFKKLAIDYDDIYPGGMAHCADILQILFHDPVVKSKIGKALGAAIDLP